MRRNDSLFLGLVNLGILKVWILAIRWWGVRGFLMITFLGTAWKEPNLCVIGVSSLSLDTKYDRVFSVHLIWFLFS